MIFAVRIFKPRAFHFEPDDGTKISTFQVSMNERTHLFVGAKLSGGASSSWKHMATRVLHSWNPLGVVCSAFVSLEIKWAAAWALTTTGGGGASFVSEKTFVKRLDASGSAATGCAPYAKWHGGWMRSHRLGREWRSLKRWARWGGDSWTKERRRKKQWLILKISNSADGLTIPVSDCQSSLTDCKCQYL